MKSFHNQNQLESEIKTYLLKKFGREVNIYSSVPLGGGCINHASKLETSEGIYFLKWNADCPAEMFLREAEGLNELKKAAGNHLVIPLVLAAKELDATPGLLILEYLEKGNFIQDSDEKLGRGLAAIHQYKNSRFGFYNNNYCGATLQDNTWKGNWEDFFRDNRIGFLLKLIQKERPLPIEEIKIYMRLLEKIPQLIPASEKPVLIHGDLWSGNYMITERGPALIDPACCYAEREMEFGIVTMFGGFSQRFYDAYNEVYPLPFEWKDRNGLYKLYHVLNHYFLFGGSYRSQALAIAKSYL
jgi:protein-ribulosamine 3-kinase